MMKYDIVLLAAERERFIDTLRGMGLVDITTTGWEPSDDDRQLLTDIESRVKALDFLTTFVGGDDYESGTGPLAKGTAYETYVAAQADTAAVKAEISRLMKIVDEWGAWGDFSVEDMRRLADAGVHMRFFTTQKSTFDKHIAEWSEKYNISLISDEGSVARFVVIGDGTGDVSIDAQEQKAPSMSVSDAEKAMKANIAKMRELDRTMSACADARGEIEAELAALKVRLQDVRIEATAENVADGMLLVMEGWAEEENAPKVDAALDAYPNVVYVKSAPTPEDDTPVKLKNNRFNRLFEVIGAMYALPKYGTIDLTPFFAPFYMLFFAICLCDAGYGAMILAAGIALLLKGGDKMRQVGWLTTVCGVACVVFGFFANSFFGMTISDASIFKGVKFINFQEDFFSVSMMIGIVQILLGMAINIWLTTRTFGFRYALGSLGWFLLIFSSCAAAVAGKFGAEWFAFGSIAYYCVVGVALVLMLLLNSPGKNIFANVGAGLWNTYNNITGLLSDVLSYIRLFAIGLSGGVLALVFNSLALGMTGLENGIDGQAWWVVALKIVGASAIILIGHGINLFMSAISSFVHPMRLTFVEFYKNAGFEMASREFEPLKKTE
ncbi:MAG: V-type ATP synthase subunit I [Alistipes sp.]|nr:V-type ATP synthase subunit I [Alistipes sp.]